MTIMSALAALCLLAVPATFCVLQIRDFTRERKQR